MSHRLCHIPLLPITTWNPKRPRHQPDNVSSKTVTLAAATTTRNNNNKNKHKNNNNN